MIVGGPGRASDEPEAENERETPHGQRLAEYGSVTRRSAPSSGSHTQA